MVETDKPIDELKPAFDLIGNKLETFITVSKLYEPIDNSFGDNVFISTSFDPLSHFESDTNNIIELYKKITGKEVDLNIEEEGAKAE